MITTTTCSACTAAITLNTEDGQATATIPSNGRRGALHVPAHQVTTDLGAEFDQDGPYLLTWECPACGDADSYDLTQ